MRPTRRALGITAAAAVLLAALVGIYWRLRAAQQQDDEAQRTASPAATPPASAEAFSSDVAVPVVRDAFVMTVSGAGQAQAARAATLFAEVGGAIIDLPAREGQPVRAGQVLARMHPAEYQLAVRQQAWPTAADKTA